MKKLIIISLIFMSFHVAAHAGKVILSEKSVKLEVDISTAKVKLSGSDYINPVVKVLVPDLAIETILDHRNTGEEAPCLATYEALTPEQVVQNRPTKETLDFNITLLKIVSPDLENGVCEVVLHEVVVGKIRGFTFTHDRSHKVGTRHIDDCK